MQHCFTQSTKQETKKVFLKNNTHKYQAGLKHSS